MGNTPIAVLSRLGLGRALAIAGESAKARTAYQDLFALWKDADPDPDPDPDIPILEEAKAEYAKLQEENQAVTAGFVSSRGGASVHKPMALKTNLDDPVSLAVDPVTKVLYLVDDVQSRVRKVH